MRDRAHKDYAHKDYAEPPSIRTTQDIHLDFHTAVLRSEYGSLSSVLLYAHTRDHKAY